MTEKDRVSEAKSYTRHVDTDASHPRAPADVSTGAIHMTWTLFVAEAGTIAQRGSLDVSLLAAADCYE